MDVSLYVPNRQSSQQGTLCSWCDPVKQFLTQSPLNMEYFLRNGSAFNNPKNRIKGVSYGCQVLRILLPSSLLVYQKWSFDSIIETYSVLSKRRLCLLIRLLEVIALKRRRMQSRQTCLYLIGIPEMIPLDNRNVLDNQDAQSRQKLFLPIKSVQGETSKNFETEFKHNCKYIQRCLYDIAFEHMNETVESSRLCHLNRRLLTAHQILWNGLSTHFDCIRELSEALSEPPISISEMKAFLCCLLNCDESNEVVQNICFEYEIELPLYQPKTLNELSKCAVLQSLREAGTLPHGLHQLYIPNRLKCILMK